MGAMDTPGCIIDLRQKNEITQASVHTCVEELEDMRVCEHRNETFARDFTTVSIVNSNGVQIGNNIYYHGPVTINQVEAPLENDVDKPTKPPDKMPTSEKAFYKRLLYFKKKKKCFIMGGFVTVGLLIVYLFILIVLMRSKSDYKPYPISTTEYFVPPPTDSDDLDSNRTRIYEHSVWTHRTASHEIDPLSTPVPIVMIMHSATPSCTIFDQCIEQIRGFQNYHMDVLDWEDIGYNFLIGGDGRIYEGRGWDKLGAHTFGWNRNSTGICLIGNFMKVDPVAEQIKATHKLIQLGLFLGKISPDYRLIAQKQVQATESPGRRLFALMADWPHFGFTTKSRKDESDCLDDTKIIGLPILGHNCDNVGFTVKAINSRQTADITLPLSFLYIEV